MTANISVCAFFCFLSVLVCFTTVGQLIVFLSSHRYLCYPSLTCAGHTSESFLKSLNKDVTKDTNLDNQIIWPIFTNICLLLLFALQHSGQASTKFKNLLTQHFPFIECEQLYNLGTSIVLQALMFFWTPLHNQKVWDLTAADNSVICWFFTGMHIFAWIAIYGGCCVMDIGSICGVKAIYHHLFNWSYQASKKSDSLLRLYSHMRHPGFISLSVILFCHPVMQMDRLILGFVLISYMVLGYKIDQADYVYQNRWYVKKMRDLNRT